MMNDAEFDRFARLLGAARGRRDLGRLLAGIGAALAVSPAAARQDDPGSAASAADNPVAAAPRRCGERRARCRADGDCCSGLACVDRRCARDRGPGTCRSEGRACARSRECCDELICTGDGRCGTRSPVRFERAWGTAGSGTDQLQDPEGVAVDTEAAGGEEVYVADTGNDRVQVFSATGAPIRRWGTSGGGDTQFRSPADVAINVRTGQVFVSDRDNNRVVEFEPDGTYVRQRGSEGTGTASFRQPRGLAVRGGTATELFVADSGNDRVQVLTGARIDFERRFGSAGTGAGQFQGPNGVAANADFVAVADTFNNRVQVFRGDTLAHIRTIGGTAAGSGDGEFDAPRGLALDDRDRIWVCDTGNDRVQVLTIDGVLSFEFGRRGTGDGQFEGPRGIAVVGNSDDGYRVYVADTLNDRIQKFTLPARA